jgi:hypothetical protein
MKFINIVVEGSSEETFVNDVLVKHFALFGKFVYARRIETGWDRINSKPAKGGFGRIPKYAKLKGDIVNWIQSDRDRVDTWYTTFVDLYAFPKDSDSPFTTQIQTILNPYQKIAALEQAIGQNINHPKFIPYVQLHEFEAFLLADPDRLISMYPEMQNAIDKLKKEIGDTNPEEINESPQTAPSKRIIKYLPDYAGQKAQVGPLVDEDIGMTTLRSKCPHFDEWITKLESI